MSTTISGTCPDCGYEGTFTKPDYFDYYTCKQCDQYYRYDDLSPYEGKPAGYTRVYFSPFQVRVLDPRQIISSNLQRLRTYAGFSRIQAASKAGLRFGQILSLETTSFDKDKAGVWLQIQKLCSLYKVSVQFILQAHDA